MENELQTPPQTPQPQTPQPPAPGDIEIDFTTPLPPGNPPDGGSPYVGVVPPPIRPATPPVQRTPDLQPRRLFQPNPDSDDEEE